jgi:hypothetical protein
MLTTAFTRIDKSCYHPATLVLTIPPNTMSSRRRNRMFTVLIALISLLFMQLAVASYACPGAIPQAAEIATMAQTAMPCEGTMASATDDQLPGLCQAHCQAEHQSAEKYQVPALVALTDIGPSFISTRVIPLPLGAPLQAPLLMRTTAPPLTVRNCCFRL